MTKRDLFESALAAEGVSGKLAEVARSIYVQESGGGKNTKTSNAGAVGGMQIKPSTFAGVADKGWDINDPLLNARAGIRYLAQMDKLSGGDPALTAVGYYGGPGGLAKAKKGIAVRDPLNPNAPSTLEYGQSVVGRLPTRRGAVAPNILAVADTAMPTPAQFAASNAPVVPDQVAQVQPAVAEPASLAQRLPEILGEDPWEPFQQAMAQAAPVTPITPDQLNFRGIVSQVPLRNEAPIMDKKKALQTAMGPLQAFKGWL